MLARYHKSKASKKARVEATFKKVHLENLKCAEEAGLNIEEWHKQMSEIGKGISAQVKTKGQEDTEIINSADYVLSYLFPKKVKK